MSFVWLKKLDLPSLSIINICNTPFFLRERNLLGRTNLHVGTILSTLSINSRGFGFAFDFPKKTSCQWRQSVRIRIFVLFILDFMLRFYFCCQNEKILCCIYCRWKRYDFQQGNYCLNGKVLKTFYIPIYNSPPSLETTFALQTFRVFEGI